MPRPNTQRNLFQDAKERGHLFAAGEVSRGVRQNETVKIFLDNSGNNRSAISGRTEVQSDGGFISEVTLNPTEDTAGTVLTPTNLRSDSNAGNKLVVKKGGEYSGGETYPQAISAIIGGDIRTIEPILSPEDTLLIEIFCRNVTGADIGIIFEWDALPKNVLPVVTDIDTGEDIP